MSVQVVIEITGDLYPTQRDVAERFIKMVQEFFERDSIMNAMEEKFTGHRMFLGEQPMQPGAGSRVTQTIYFHRDAG